MAVQLVTHRFTAKDFHRMVEAGILHEDDRVELLHGEIVDMPPIGPGHAASVRRLLNGFLPLQLEGKVIISVQGPIHLGEHSEPQPDLALLKPWPDFYGQRHPTPQEVLLVVEVMERSAGYDREVKVPLDARVGNPETWLLDGELGLIEVYREPSPDGYRQVHTRRRGERLSPVAFPQFILVVDEVLG
jgi:Uma2 family endonuclease